MESEKKLFLLDASALIYRSYYAFIRNPRYNSKGLNTSAILGFLNTLEDVLNKPNPSHIAVVFDPPGPTFRNEMYAEYKAHREKTPEDIVASLPYIKKMLEAFNIPIIEEEGYEADDVIGTLAGKASGKGFKIYMMTPDKDFCQLVSEDVFIYKPKRGGNDAEVWGVKEVKDQFMVDSPGQVVDVLALMGDTSDNVPGVPGIGEVTAKKIISRYKSVENVIENIESFKGKQKENLQNSKEKITLSKKLVTINRNVPLEFDEKNLKRSKPDIDLLRELFQELEFRTAAERVFRNITEREKDSASNDAVQGSLFGNDNTVQQEKNDEGFATISTTPHKYFLAGTGEKIASLADKLSGQSSFCFDVETTSINPHRAELVGMAFSFSNYEAWYVPFPDDRSEAEKLLSLFKPVLEDESILKAGQNIKYDIIVLKYYNVHLKGEVFDTMLAHYLLQPEQRHNMDYLAEVYLKYRPVRIEELIGEKGKNQRSMRSVDLEKVSEYAGEDADITWQLKGKLEEELKKNDLFKLAIDIEMPLAPVLACMEYNGVKLDEGSIRNISGGLRDDLTKIEKEIFGMAGTEFNISSPKQLGEVLFDKMKITDKARRTRTKQYSTSEEVLEKLQDKHEIIPKILEFRGLKKLLSTYIEALPKLINPSTGKIHTSFNQAVTSTGRLSSTNPNLQNIPIREERGRLVRKAFIPESNQNILLSADYSQIELRLMAHMSQDEDMIKAFLNNEDIHSSIASKIYDVKKEDVTREMRARAKTANFGIIYGISAFGLSQRLNIPREEASDLIKGYFTSYPGVKKYMDRCIEKARNKGFVETIMGRKRFLPDILSNNSIVRGMAERNAINTPLQGSAADIIKLAMIRIHALIHEKGMKSKMILQVHDELIFDARKNELEDLKELVEHEMSGAAELRVPLLVDMGTGDNWLEAH